jgi:hypothetical protein
MEEQENLRWPILEIQPGSYDRPDAAHPTRDYDVRCSSGAPPPHLARKLRRRTTAPTSYVPPPAVACKGMPRQPESPS